MQDTSCNACLVSRMTSCRALKYPSSRSTLLAAISHRASLKWANNLASSSKSSSFLGREPEADASVASLRWDRVITRGARSLVTRELIGCDPGDTFIHRGPRRFSQPPSSWEWLPALGWHRHLLSVFLHEAMGHLGHCFSKVKIVIPLSMAGG